LTDEFPCSDEVITLVSGLHKAGYIHGDLASRNFVQFDDGLRIIDLGRAEKADEEERAWEMSELEAVLAGSKDEIEYEGML
jgi:tRNA A-37 threonylcarbamoyl transferase component Bud32